MTHLFRWFPVAAAAALALAPSAARAAACTFTPAQFVTARNAVDGARGFTNDATIGMLRWDIPQSLVLCPGTYEMTGAMYLRAGRRLDIGEATTGPTAGLPGVTILRATSIKIQGELFGDGNGTQANGCANTNRGAGTAGYTPVANGGGGGATWTTAAGNGGGGGGGGGAHGDTVNGSGAGGRGNNANAAGGNNAVGFGSATDTTTNYIGASGGGGACSDVYNVFGNGVVGNGGNGGRGGAGIVLDAKDLEIGGNGTGTNGLVHVNAVAGGNAPGGGFTPGGGGGGGGGAGGTLVVRSTEAITVTGVLQANGGAGGNGTAGNNGRQGGGGGGGAGGRIKIERASACTTLTTSVAAGASGARAGGNAVAGEVGYAGSVNCANIQVAPVVSALTAAPASLNEGGGTVLTATATDANGHLLRYEFDCDGDASTGNNGGFESVPAVNTTNTFTCPAYTDNGTRTVRVRVTDWNSSPVLNGTASNVSRAANTVAMGGATIGQATVTVNNVAPTATLTVPATVDEGTQFTATGAATDPSSVDTAAGFTFAWNMGDTATYTGTGRTTVQHTYADNGTRTITLNVTDKDGGTGTVTQVVTVNNKNPVPVLGTLPTGVVQDPNANTAGPYLEALTTFTASGTDPSSADQAAGFAYTFTFTPPGGGAAETLTVARTAGNATQASVQRRFAVTGVWTLSVTIVDKDGGSATTAAGQFTVNPRGAERGPDIVLTAAPGATIDESGNVTITATLSDPNSGDNAAGFTLAWRCTPASTPVAATIAAGASTARTATFQCTYPDSGAVTASVTATDRTGASNSGSIAITVRNVAPIVVAGAAPTGVSEGGSARVTATATDLSPADTTAGFTYAFDFGDGTPTVRVTGAGSAESSHQYPNSGTYTVGITATDVDGATSARVTVDVVVANVAPQAVLTAPAGGNEGAQLAFSVAATDVSPSDTTAGFTYAWNFGDGTPVESGTGAAFTSRTHPFPQNGTFNVSVTVTDADGGASTATAAVSIANLPPTVALGGDVTVVRGENLTLAPTVSDPGTADVLTFAWDFGDGTTSTDRAPVKSYPTLGNFTMRLVVSDDGGGSASDQVTVHVVNRQPVAANAAVAPAEPRSFDDLVLTYSVTDADNDPTTTTRIAWFVDDAPVADLANTDTVPASRTRRGQVWRATVTPNDGIEDGTPVESNRVTIGNIAPTAADVVVTPAAPLKADTLALAYTYADEDGDAEQGTTIAWLKNGVEQPALANAPRVPAPLTKGDSWVARVTPNDGALAGTAVSSAAVTVGNTPPAITRLDDVASPATGATTPVTWTIGASDADGDTLSYACTLDGTTIGTGATQSSSFAVGTYTITCTVSDGTDSTTDDLTVAVGDVPPIVDAGADQTVDPGRPRVTAQGRDTLGRPLSYTWTVVRSPATVSLLTPSQASTEFFAKAAGDYELKVTVSNGSQTATDNVVVTVRNVRPSADAGPATRTGTEGVAVTLDGSLSTDPNGDTLTYLWERVSGPAITGASDPTGTSFSFTPSVAGELVVRLTVSDGALTGSVQATIRVAPAQAGNTPPVARAGNDGTALVGETVPLDGTGSYDLDPGTTLAYSWEAISGPATTIANAAAAQTSFTASAEGTYVFRLSVTDGTFTATDDVAFTVTTPVDGNHRPVARVTPAEVDAIVNQTVTLDGASSTDPDGDTITYQWTQVSGPGVGFGAGDQPGITFVPTVQGVVVLELVVSDGRLSSRAATATVRVAEASNQVPVAAATATSGEILVGALVTLDGSGSQDPEGATLTYAWTQAAGPTVALSATDAVSPTFTPAAAGTYTFSLVVNDGLFDSTPATVSVTVIKNDKPVAVAKGPSAGMVGEPVVLDGSSSSDAEGATLTFAWTRVSGPAATLSGADTAAPGFTPTEAGTYVFQLVVNDGRWDSDPAQVTVEVEAIPALTGGCSSMGLEAGLMPLLGLVALRRRRR